MRQALDWSEVAYVLGAGRARAGDSGGGGLEFSWWAVTMERVTLNMWFECDVKHTGNIR